MADLLNWWTGHASSDATNSPDDCETPKTPAPIFAARALRSAVFGTPGYVDETTIADIATSKEPSARQGAESPTKRGILMTPGTAASRRKTVSFGTSVVDNEGKNASGTSGLPSDFPGKFPSPWTPKFEPQTGSRRTTLTKALEDSRTSTLGQSKLGKADTTGRTEPTKKVEKGNSHVENGMAKVAQDVNLIDFDGDITMDLNKPHSQSGRYWKSEYERYHEEAKEEMRKLATYQKLAKSYARRKDSEAVDLSEKLKEQQQMVLQMEMKVVQLAAHLTSKQAGGVDNDSSELAKDLARQTALATQYKDEVDRFRLALYDHDEHLDKGKRDVSKGTSPRTAQTLLEVSHELKMAREQLKTMHSLRSEIHSLRLNVSAAERKATKLQNENTALTHKLKKAEADLKNTPKGPQPVRVHDDQTAMPLKKLQEDYDKLKETAKWSRGEAEQLLRKRHDQVASLKKEIKSLREQMGLTIGANLKERPASLPTRATQPSVIAKDELKSTSKQLAAETSAPTTELDSFIMDSRIPVSGRSTLKHKKSLHSLPDITPTETQRSLDSALSEVVNNGQSPVSRPTQGINMTPLVDCLPKISLQSSAPALPSLQPAHVSADGTSHKRRYRTSIPNYLVSGSPSTDIKHAVVRPRSSGTDRPALLATQTASGLSSMTSTRSRTTIPPERAAAAKARLELRNAEKRRAHELSSQKENVRG